MHAPIETRLGVITDGSLTKGLTARLNQSQTVEDVRVGRFVKIQGDKWDFFCLVTDVVLNAANPQVLDEPPPPDDAFLRDVLSGTATYGSVLLQPMLMLAKDSVDGFADLGPRPGNGSGHHASSLDDALFGRPLPVRTIPVHFAPVDIADEADFNRVFAPEGEKAWEVGTPLDMDIPVRLDLERLAQRSNGVFGKSGSGKSMLTRVLLCGLIRARSAVNLIFDMHSEYAWSKRDEGSGTQLKPLKELFGSRVAVYTMQSKRSRPAANRADGVIHIGLNEIELDDIALLADLLKLNETAIETIYLLQDRFQDHWIASLLEMDTAAIRAFSDEAGAHPAAVTALRRKLNQLDQLDFVTRDHVPQQSSSIEFIIKSLADGQNVVLAFEQSGTLLSYMLVANVITRRIYERWQHDTQAADAGEGPKPHHLIITVEEAHRFLSPAAARHTSFGTIARELRKYNVTLLIVDQRPSAIDPEVLSQIGTRLTCQLNDENDIGAILAGVSGASHLRSVLAALDSQQQAMLLGHAVPMPISIKVRTIDDRFYEDVTAGGHGSVFPGGVRPSQLLTLPED